MSIENAPNTQHIQDIAGQIGDSENQVTELLGNIVDVLARMGAIKTEVTDNANGIFDNPADKVFVGQRLNDMKQEINTFGNGL